MSSTTPQCPGSVIVPDGYIVFGVDTDTIEMYRRSYRIDEWGVPPRSCLKWHPRARRRGTWVKSARYTLGWALRNTGVWTGTATMASRWWANGLWTGVCEVRVAYGSQRRCMVSQRGLGRGLLSPLRRRHKRLSAAGQRDGQVAGRLGEEVAAHAETEAAHQARKRGRKRRKREIVNLRRSWNGCGG